MKKFFLRHSAMVAVVVALGSSDVGANYVVDGSEQHAELSALSDTMPTFCVSHNLSLALLAFAYNKKYAELRQYRNKLLEKRMCAQLLQVPDTENSSLVAKASRNDHGSPITIATLLTIGMWLDKKSGIIYTGRGFIVAWTGEKDAGFL